MKGSGTLMCGSKRVEVETTYILKFKYCHPVQAAFGQRINSA